jgi:prophage regulatory protein
MPDDVLDEPALSRDKGISSAGGPALWRLARVLEHVGLSRSDLYRRVKAGTFPRPIPISNSRIATWDSSAVEAWVAAQISAAAD